MKVTNNCWRLASGCVLALIATSADAVPAYGGDGDSPPKPVIGAHIFGKYTGKAAQVLSITAVGATRICSVDNVCRVANGLAPITRATQVRVAQPSNWNRTGILGKNANELIACFAYLDQPASVSFSCQTQQADSSATTAQLEISFAQLATRAYRAAGLMFNPSSMITQVRAQRAGKTAAAKISPPSKTVALDTLIPLPGSNPWGEEDDKYRDLIGGGRGGWGGDSNGGGGEGYTGPVIGGDGSADNPFNTIGDCINDICTLEPVWVTGSGIVNTLYTNFGDLWAWNSCVSFDVCPTERLPLLPPWVAEQKKQCLGVCGVRSSQRRQVCNLTTVELGSAVAVGAVAGGVVVGIGLGAPEGYLFFKSVGAIGGFMTAGYGGLCYGADSYWDIHCVQDLCGGP